MDVNNLVSAITRVARGKLFVCWLKSLRGYYYTVRYLSCNNTRFFYKSPTQEYCSKNKK